MPSDKNKADIQKGRQDKGMKKGGADAKAARKLAAEAEKQYGKAFKRGDKK